MDKFKTASSSLGERLITSGAQMSKMVTSKMKELLAGPTPESKFVDDATSDTMNEPNWSLNLRICSMINNDELNGTEVVKSIKKKLGLNKNPVAQRLSLDLLETCTSNCEKVFSEVASEKVLEEMVRMTEDPKTASENRVRAVEMITAWGENEDLAYLPIFRLTYMNFKKKYPLESETNDQLLSPPESYLIPDRGLPNHEQTGYIGESIEEKKELLEISRNSLDILSSILNSEVEPKPIKDDLAVSMLQSCKESLAVIRRIVETTSDDEALMYEALNLHDEVQQVISRYEEMEAALESGERLPKTTENGSNLLNVADTNGGNLGKSALDASESYPIAPTKGESNQSHHDVVKPGISGEEKLG